VYTVHPLEKRRRIKCGVPGRYSTSDTSVYDPKANSLGQLPLRYTTSNAIFFFFLSKQTHGRKIKKELCRDNVNICIGQEILLAASILPATKQHCRDNCNVALKTSGP